MTERIAVSVAYAERERQTVIELELPAGATVATAIEASGIRARHPGIAADAATGIHGRRVGINELLADGDRVELYRPLPADPKETRRALAREGRSIGTRRG